MKIGKLLKYHGNINRIMEMHAAGVQPHGIVGAFRDHDIHITHSQVVGIIESYAPLTSKALPKSAADDQIAGTRAAFGNTGLVPA